jgi:hypothetical protein
VISEESSRLARAAGAGTGARRQDSGHLADEGAARRHGDCGHARLLGRKIYGYSFMMPHNFL